MDVQTRIAQSELFQGLPHQSLAPLTAQAVVKRFKKGETIFLEGAEAKGFYLVSRGKVKIFKSNFAGKEQILHVFGPGQAFAEAAVFEGRRYPANALALEELETVFFEAQGFRRILAQNPDLSLRMLGLLSARLKAFARMIDDLSLKEVPARLASYFLLLSASTGKTRFDLELTKGQLAGFLGTIPETLSRILKKLAEAELIRVEGSVIEILDAEQLRELAEGQSGV